VQLQAERRARWAELQGQSLAGGKQMHQVMLAYEHEVEVSV